MRRPSAQVVCLRPGCMGYRTSLVLLVRRATNLLTSTVQKLSSNACSRVER